MVGAVFSPPQSAKTIIPDVVPMRRGRPTAGSQGGHVSKPSPSPIRGTTSDPFAALDGKSAGSAMDDISTRFPSLDQFSLLHDGGKFDFDASSPIKGPQKDLGQRVTEKLADDAFALPKPKTQTAGSNTQPSAAVISRAQKIISSNPELQKVSSPPPIVYQPTPTRPPTSSYVSQGTMTSPTPPNNFRLTPTSDHHRSSSLPRNQEATKSPLLRPEENRSLHPGSVARNPPYGAQPGHTRHASSSRPSLEGGRPSNDGLDPPMRTRSSMARPRPPSTYLDSNMDYLREKEKESSGRPSLSTEKRPSYSKDNAVTEPASDEETNIESNVDYLRTIEDQESSKKDRRRSSGANKKDKRSSMPSLSLGTKNILAGKFGDAFKRFENNTSAQPGPRTPSPLQELERRDLTPIAGSEATDGRSDDGQILEDADDLAPEQRRELERRRLSMEERRVADAAAEYRKRLADGGARLAPRSIGGVSRATSIQNKVKTLLDENAQSSPTKKTAEGYGRFTDSPAASQPSQLAQQSMNPYTKPTISRKPVIQGIAHARTLPNQSDLNYAKPRAQAQMMAPATISKTGGSRPNAPPKPMHLNSINTGPQKPVSLPSRPLQARPDMTPQEKEDYIADFSKRYPSLSGIEMVETEIERDDSRNDHVGVGARSRVV